jgi:hypothetical protein
MKTRDAAFALVLVCSLGGCSSDAAPPAGSDRGAPPVTAFNPDVPSWRGGCFFDGPATKIVNGSPSPDVRMFGHACDGTPRGSGGLVYVDRYDPVGGTGDVTVLLSKAGSRPVTVGKNGGGALVNGSSGARFNDGGTKLLVLADVTFVTGTLELVDLASPEKAAPIASTATSVRAENYEFLPGDGVLYVNNYSPGTRRGDLYYQATAPPGPPSLVALQASRFDVVMYRLSPDRGRVAFLSGFTPAAGGNLFVQMLPPAGPVPASPIAIGVTSMSWTADGSRLVYLTQNADTVTSDVWSWDPSTGRSSQLGTQAISVVVAGNDVLLATGWTVLSQQSTLHLFPARSAASDGLAASSVSRSFDAVEPTPGAGLAAYATVPASDPSTGSLFVAKLSGGTGSPLNVDSGVSIAAGFRFSPGAAFVAYAKGFTSPAATGSGNAQPGIAHLLRFASAAGTAFDLAEEASLQHVAWDPSPGEPHVAAIANFEPAGDEGDLVVRTTADGAPVTPLPLAQRVSATWFDFADDGSSLAALQNWDGGLQRGELVLVPTSGPNAWRAQAVPDGGGATFFLSHRGRAVYGVRGNAHEGLWLAPAAR